MGDSIWNNFLDETMKERYELVAERIVEISKEPQVPECYKDYFSETAAYLEKTMELCQMAIAGTLQQRSLGRTDYFCCFSRYKCPFGTFPLFQFGNHKRFGITHYMEPMERMRSANSAVQAADEAAK